MLLDRNPGAAGHQYVFLVLSLFGLIGMITGWLFVRYANGKSTVLDSSESA
jgi:hypothetical protein